MIPISGLKAQVAVADGSVAAPSISFSNDVNTGFYRPGADTVGLVTGGSERLRIDLSGNVGIGVTSPEAKLHLVGDLHAASGYAKLAHGFASALYTYTFSSTTIVYGCIGYLTGFGEHVLTCELNNYVGTVRIMFDAATWINNSTSTVPLTVHYNNSVNFVNPITEIYLLTNNPSSGQSNPEIWIKMRGNNSTFVKHTYRTMPYYDHSGDVGIGLGTTNSRIGSALPAGYTVLQTYTLNASSNFGATGFMGQNVGIGSANPQAKLDVVGDIQYTTSVKRNGTVLPMIMNVQQSVYSVKSGTYNPGTTWVDTPIPPLTLTPASASSRFHIRANVTYSMQGGLTTVAFRFVRNGTPIGVGSGGTYNCSFRHVPSTSAGTEQQYWAWSVGGEYIDSPATTSACTYKLQVMSYDTSRTLVFNNQVVSASTGDNNCAISTLIVTELAV